MRSQDFCSRGLLLLLLLSRFSRVRLCTTPWTAAYRASLSMGSRLIILEFVFDGSCHLSISIEWEAQTWRLKVSSLLSF